MYFIVGLAYVMSVNNISYEWHSDNSSESIFYQKFIYELTRRRSNSEIHRQTLCLHKQ